VSGGPVQQYVPPYGQGPEPPAKKGMSPVMIIVIIIVVIVALLVIAAILFFSFISDIGGEPWEETNTFETEVYVQDGGHYRYALVVGWEDELTVNLSLTQLEGGPYDVYIMDWNQYENAYGNWSTGGFSSIASWQDVTTFSESVTLELPGGRDYYVVIDNAEMDHVPGDTAPDGDIHVDLELVMTSRFDSTF
jgi:hypothetical protein